MKSTYQIKSDRLEYWIYIFKADGGPDTTAGEFASYMVGRKYTSRLKAMHDCERYNMIFAHACGRIGKPLMSGFSVYKTIKN